MFPRILILIAVFLLFNPVRAQVGESEHEHLLERQATFLAAMASKDVDATAEHFAEDAILHIANMPPIQGRETIRTFYSNVFLFMEESETVPESVQIAASADMAYTTGRVINSFQGEGESVSYSGKYLLIWENLDNEWLISVYAVSNNSSEVPR